MSATWWEAGSLERTLARRGTPRSLRSAASSPPVVVRRCASSQPGLASRSCSASSRDSRQHAACAHPSSRPARSSSTNPRPGSRRWRLSWSPTSTPRISIARCATASAPHGLGLTSIASPGASVPPPAREVSRRHQGSRLDCRLVSSARDNGTVRRERRGWMFKDDLRALGLRTSAGAFRDRGGRDLRAWFITSRQEHGAHRDLLRVVTHTANGDIVSGYTRATSAAFLRRTDPLVTDGDTTSGQDVHGSSRTRAVASLATALAVAVLASDHERARALAEELRALQARPTARRLRRSK